MAILIGSIGAKTGGIGTLCYCLLSNEPIEPIEPIGFYARMCAHARARARGYTRIFI